jgi:hypothetical protein
MNDGNSARGMAASFGAGRQRVREINADGRRMDFLKQLDDAEFSVTDWEAQFITSFIDQPRGFTDGQRKAVDQMMEKYQPRLS